MNYPGLGVSPDGLIGADGMLEIKCPNSSTHIEYLERKVIPSQYKVQVQMQLWVAERDWCDFVSFDPRFPPASQLKVITVERHEPFITELAQKLGEFVGELDKLVGKHR